jgi:hypothetical protein
LSVLVEEFLLHVNCDFSFWNPFEVCGTVISGKVTLDYFTWFEIGIELWSAREIPHTSGGVSHPLG